MSSNVVRNDLTFYGAGILLKRCFNSDELLLLHRLRRRRYTLMLRESSFLFKLLKLLLKLKSYTFYPNFQVLDYVL